ncbi:hypothetical protein HDU92_008176 [Lobulomyces angularis]|nr:hypothetical protein HDU92_008176 [Lobulomyces angularis]
MLSFGKEKNKNVNHVNLQNILKQINNLKQIATSYSQTFINLATAFDAYESNLLSEGSKNTMILSNFGKIFTQIASQIDSMSEMMQNVLVLPSRKILESRAQKLHENEIYFIKNEKELKEKINKLEKDSQKKIPPGSPTFMFNNSTLQQLKKLLENLNISYQNEIFYKEFEVYQFFCKGSNDISNFLQKNLNTQLIFIKDIQNSYNAMQSRDLEILDFEKKLLNSNTKNLKSDLVGTKHYDSLAAPKKFWSLEGKSAKIFTENFLKKNEISQKYEISESSNEIKNRKLQNKSKVMYASVNDKFYTSSSSRTDSSVFNQQKRGSLPSQNDLTSMRKHIDLNGNFFIKENSSGSASCESTMNKENSSRKHFSVNATSLDCIMPLNEIAENLDTAKLSQKKNSQTPANINQESSASIPTSSDKPLVPKCTLQSSFPNIAFFGTEDIKSIPVKNMESTLHISEIVPDNETKSNVATLQGIIEYAIVKWDYEARSGKELNIKKGELLKVNKKHGQNWVHGILMEKNSIAMLIAVMFAGDSEPTGSDDLKRDDMTTQATLTAIDLSTPTSTLVSDDCKSCVKNCFNNDQQNMEYINREEFRCLANNCGETCLLSRNLPFPCKRCRLLCFMTSPSHDDCKL